MTLDSLTDTADADLRLVADSIPHIVWLARPDGYTEYFNRQGSDFTGFPAVANCGWDWLLLVHPDDAEAARLAWEAATRANTPYRHDHRIRRFDGEYRWHAFRASPIFDECGWVRKWIGTATDVEDAKRTEADLRAAEHASAQTLTLLEALQSSAPVGFGFVDRDLRIVRLNETLATINGSTVAEQVGELVADVVPQLWSHLEPLYRHVLDTGEAILDLAVDVAAPADPSRVGRWLTSYYPIHLDDEIIGIGVVLVDITSQREAEEALRFQAELFAAAGQAVIAVDLQRVVISWNKAAEEMYGWSAAEAIGRNAIELIPREETRTQTRELHDALASGRSWSGSYEVRRRDGSMRSIDVTNTPFYDHNQRLVAVIGASIDVTDRVATQRALEASGHRLAEAQRIAHIGSFESDYVTGQRTWSDEAYRILGLDPGLEASDELFMSCVHPDDRKVLGGSFADAARGDPFDIEFRVLPPDSLERCVRARGIPELAHDGTLVRVAGTVMDDTERVLADRVRRAAETRFEIGFEQSAIGAVISDLDGLPTRVNGAVCAILGRSEPELIGRRWTEYAHPDEIPLGNDALSRVAAGHDTYEAERRYMRPDGVVVWTQAIVTLVRDASGSPQYFYTQLQDTTERKQLELELAHQALHDSLTGLPNRALLTDRLVHGLAGSRRRGSQLGVIFVDIDEFKGINDSMGHSTGDELLRCAAKRIEGAIRVDDTAARFGGDEFAVVCDDVTAFETEQIAERVLAALSEPWCIGNQEMHVTASLGVAVSDASATPESMLRDSDAAMYRAKERGKGRIELFDETLRSKNQRRFATASQLHLALERDEFTIHYQPIVDLSTGAVVSAEALLRWNHPARGLVSPAEFIPLAEESGLIVPIGAWVLEHACRQLAEWKDIQRSTSVDASLSVSVNLSVRQLLAPDIAGLVEGVLARTGVPPGDLCLELTESVFMEDADYFGRTLAGLKAVGVGLSMDDFGTGYSSLAYLKRFPVDAVKIDRGFVDGLGTDPHSTALVAAIVAMAGALDLAVTAEGVETPAQLSIVRGLGVRWAQGFYLARPMPADRITQLIETEHRYPVD